jgi:hypothetical protein
MVRYLHHLQTDIRQSIEMAPKPLEIDLLPAFEEEEGISTNYFIKLPDLFGIPAEAFPPSTFLTDIQLKLLLQNLATLWKSWLLYWDMPLELTSLQQYDAMLHAMKNEQIAWHCERGAAVKICQYESGSYCPFGEGGFCYCKVVNEAAKHDIEVWEEHVRSQGIDPYEELSEEAGAAFEAENRKRDLRKRNEDDWQQLEIPDLLFDLEADGSFFAKGLDMEQNDDWLDNFYWENHPNINLPTDFGSQQGHGDPLDDFFEDDFPDKVS